MDYILEKNITNDLLINNGFKKTTYINGTKEEYVYVYIKNLIDDIYLYISINSFDNNMMLNSISVLEDTFGRPYQPFYNEEKSETVNKIVDNYKKQMNKLIDLGIFKINQKILKKEM